MKLSKTTLFAAAMFIGINVAQASGFAILEQTPSGMGNSLAGMTADIKDPASVYFNPATSVWFDLNTVSAGIHALKSRVNFKGEGNYRNGPDGGDAGGWEAIPNLYWVHKISPDFAFSIGGSATSGTSTRYDRGWVGRYQSIKTEIQVAQFSPALSYRVNEYFSIGAGLVVEYANAIMTRAIPVTDNDYELKVEGDSLAIGYTFGATFVPRQDIRIGIGYRSEMRHELKMDGTLHGLFDFDAGCNLNLPAVLNFGAQYDIGQFTLKSDVSYTYWSIMDDLTLNTNNKLLGDKNQVMNWRNTWRVAFGADYRLNEKWTLRAGIAFDQTPIQDTEHRYASLPDGHRYWLSCGFSYQPSSRMSFDVGYMHIFFHTADIDSHGLKGYTRGSADVLSFSMMYKY